MIKRMIPINFASFCIKINNIPNPMMMKGLAPPIKFPIRCGIDMMAELASCPKATFDAKKVISDKVINSRSFIKIPRNFL